MADQDTKAPEAPPLPTLEEMQHWTWVMGRAQQMMLEHVAKAMGEAGRGGAEGAAALPWLNLFGDPAKIAQQQVGAVDRGARHLAARARRPRRRAPSSTRKPTRTSASPPRNGATIRCST